MNVPLKQIKSALISSLTAAILTVSSSTQAASLTVKEIEISNALGSWLQISELAATGSNDNAINLTTHATVSATSTYWDGISHYTNATDNNTETFYAGGSEGNDIFKISFKAETTLNSFSLRARTDFNNYRDVYNVVFKDKDGNVLHELKNWDGRIAKNDIVRQNNGVLTTNFAEVPIPAPALLFAPALLGFMGIRRKVKAKI